MTTNYGELFTEKTLKRIFPQDRSDHFFDALYGDPAEGAYDIGLKFKGNSQGKLHFVFELKERPGKCLACNLTYGLPNVLGRHPVINVKGLVEEIEKLLAGKAKCSKWHLGRTEEVSRKLHVVPLVIELE